MKELSYQIVRSARKTVAIQILPNGEVIVRAPARMPIKQIRSFVESKQGWIAQHLPKKDLLPPFTEQELRELKRQAAEVLPGRVAHFAPLVGVGYGRITVRSQHTRWGSCSAKGNLNFNCLLMLTPPEVRDYVVIHELCHRKQLDHSAAFWAEVERACPNYRQHRAWLRDHGTELIGRLSRCCGPEKNEV